VPFQVAVLLASPLLRMVAGELALSLVCQLVQTAACSAARRAARRRREPERAPAVAGTVNSPRAAAASEDTQRRRSSAREPVIQPVATSSSVDVVSAVPGRVRLRVRGLRHDEARAREIEATLSTLAAVTMVRANPLTGTVLVHGEPEHLSAATLQAALALPTPKTVGPLAIRVRHLRLVVG